MKVVLFSCFTWLVVADDDTLDVADVETEVVAEEVADVVTELEADYTGQRPTNAETHREQPQFQHNIETQQESTGAPKSKISI